MNFPGVAPGNGRIGFDVRAGALSRLAVIERTVVFLEDFNEMVYFSGNGFGGLRRKNNFIHGGLG
jgi:hypothetical protein